MVGNISQIGKLDSSLCIGIVCQGLANTASHANSNLILAEKQLALYKLKLDPAPFQKSFLSQGWVDDIQSFLNASLPAPWPMQYEAYQIDSEFDNKKERHCKK